MGFGIDIANGYTAGLSGEGHFRPELAAEFYGPLIGAILFKKVMSKLKGKLLF